MTIDVTNHATSALETLQLSLAGDGLKNAIGRGVSRAVKDNFATLPTNRQGWPSTGFWADATRSTNHQITGDGVMVSVNKQGVRQRLQGGEIRAVNSKFLTIPATPETYGHRASEITGLRFAVLPGVGPALVAQRATASVIEAATRGKKKFKVVAEQFGTVVMFWLKRSVNQKPNPRVLPSGENLLAAALNSARNYLSGVKPQGGLA